jgi:hypothetical protein
MSTDSCATWAILGGETNQTLTITQNGSYYVEMTDANGCTGNSAGCFTANYDVIHELNSVWNMVIVPNPNSGIFEVRLTTGIPGNYTLEICDEAGRVVFTNVMGHVQKTAQTQVDISHHQRGIYLLKLIQNDKAVAVKRIMKM